MGPKTRSVFLSPFPPDRRRCYGTAIPFEQAGVTDSTTIYAFPITAGLAPDAAFSFDLVTDLLFCDASEVCITPILGCADDPALTAAAFVAFDPACNTNMFCYRYNAGQAIVRTTFGEPQTLDLCETQTLTVQYFNDGTSDLSDFSPVLYLPEGLTASNYMFAVTGGASGPLADPVYSATDSTSNLVFGQGLTFDQTEINAAVGGDGFNPGEVLTISFDAQTGCDFTSGTPLVSLPQGDAACMEEFIGQLAFSSNIDVALPDGPQAVVTFDVDEQPLVLSCSDAGDRLVITAANIGKDRTMQAEICITLPDGISLDLDNVNVLAPEGYTIDATDVVTTPVNASGAVQQCFPAPEFPAGGFACLEIPFLVDDVPCGPTFIAATILSSIEVGCANPIGGDTDPCTISVSTAENLYIPIEIAPAVTATNATLSAACTGTPGVFNIDYAFDFLAESQDYNGDVVLRLYSDVDADGEFDDAIDTQIGTEQTVAVNALQDVPQTFTGVFPGVDQDEICPLLLVIESVGCECSESVLSFPEVLPDFIFDLGDAIVLCPGEPFTFDGLCADLSFLFADPAAGTVTVDEVSGEATIMLNEGFGVNPPAELIVSGSFGTCGLEKSIDVSAPEMVGFGPYEYTVCNVGSQEVDLNIPSAQQEDIAFSITPSANIVDPTSFEPIIEDLAADQVFDVEISFNDGACSSMTTLTVTVEEAPTVTVSDFTACQSGFDLRDRLVVTPTDLVGSLQTEGDGKFVSGSDINDVDGNPLPIRYIPGPLEIEQGFVSLRFVSDDPDGPCGPATERIRVTILLVDCGTFIWDGQ